MPNPMFGRALESGITFHVKFCDKVIWLKHVYQKISLQSKISESPLHITG